MIINVSLFQSDHSFDISTHPKEIRLSCNPENQIYANPL
jgi:hypothetical protein